MISVIIPAYNESKIIGEVIRELIIELNKTENDYEIIISDNHSNDETAGIIKELHNNNIVRLDAIPPSGERRHWGSIFYPGCAFFPCWN